MLSTGYFSLGIPALGEEFGLDTVIDLICITSQKFINEKYPDVRPSGVFIEKDGNIKITFNTAALINSYTENGWVESRRLYITF